MSTKNPHHTRFFWRSSAMFSFLNKECRFQEVNSAWETTLGLSTGQLLAKHFLDFVHPDDKPFTQYYFEQLDDGLPSVAFSARFRHYGGFYRNVLWEINGAASAEFAYYAVGMDITSREQPMVADEMISVLQDGVVLQYANGTIGACNPSAERILGLSAEQMMGWTLIDPDWRAIREDGSPFPAETQPAICTLRTGQSYADVVMGVVKSDDSVIWIRLNSYPLWRDDVTTPYAVVISFSDITRYKETEQGLRKSSEQHGGVVSENNYDLWDWDLATNEMHFLPSWEKMLGFDEHELEQQVSSWHQRIHPQDYERVMTDIQSYLEGKTRICENTHRLQHKDGSYSWVLSRAVVVRYSSGKALRLVGTHVDMTEPHRIEDDLNEIENKYQQLLNIESDAIFIIDVETTDIIEVNKSATHLYGYSHSQLLKLQYVALSAQPDKIMKSIKKAMKLTSMQHHKKQDGTIFPVEMTISPFLFKGKSVLMVVVRDITERQKIEATLWENESKYRQLFEATSSPTVVFDANTQKIFDINQAAIDLYGYGKNEWLQMTTEDISAEPAKKRGAFGSGNKRMQLTPLRWHKKKDSTVFPVEISSGNTYLFQGRSLICATLRDITERKAYEEALRRERDFVKSLIEASPTFFVALNPDGTIRIMNNAMLQATGYSYANVENSDFLTLFVSEQERSVVATEFENLTKSMQPSLLECHILTKSGKFLLVEWHSRTMVKADGELDYFFGVGINVTERKNAQEHLHLFKYIIDSSKEAIIIIDASEQLIYLNQAYEKLFGCDQKQAKLMDILDHYSVASIKIWKQKVIPALTEGDSWEGELEVYHENGSLFTTWQQVDAVRDIYGNILFSFSIMHNIGEPKPVGETGESKPVGETLDKQLEEYQDIFNTVPAMIWYRDKNNLMLRQNKRAEEIFRSYNDEFERYTDCEKIIQSGYPEIGIVHRLNYNFEDNTTPMPNGKESSRRLQFDKIPHRDAQGNITGVIVFAIDITKYKQDKEPVLDNFEPWLSSESDTFLLTMFEQAKLGVCLTDDRGRFLQVNYAYADLYGYRPEELIGQPFTTVLSPSTHDRAIREYYSLLMTNQNSMFFKQQNSQHRDGQVFEVQIMASPVIFEDRRRMLVSIVNKHED